MHMLSRAENHKDHKDKLKQNRIKTVLKYKCFKFSTGLWKCVTRSNVCWQTVPQPSTSSGEGSVSNSCTLWLADIQLMG